MSKLASASIAKQNAAFDVVYPELKNLVGDYVPPMFQYQILQKLQEPAVRQRIVGIIDDALNAAEKVP